MNVNKLLRLCSRLSSMPHRNYSKNYQQKNVLNIAERGIFVDTFPGESQDEISKLLCSEKRTVYAGFDPSADSLHIGNLLVLINLIHWHRYGHQVIIVLGGATGTVGDPSHRTTERSFIQQKILEHNISGIKTNIESIFENYRKYIGVKENDQLMRPIILNNAQWYKDLNAIDFISNIGKHFRLGTMLGRSSVQDRLNSETGLSFSEFSYSVLQAYDWYYLKANFDCIFQIGGNDQMGNIVAGHDLIGRMLHEKVYGITLPLILTKAGQKLGKSADNALWLAPSKSTCFEFYQHFIRTADADVERFLNFFTFIPIDEISVIMDEHNEKPEARKAQKILATHITTLVHGEAGLKQAQRTSAALYSQSIDSIAQMDPLDMVKVFQNANLVQLCFDISMTVYQLAMKANCFKTAHDAERIILAGGFYINHQRITNLEEVLVPGIHVLSNNTTLVRVGKKNYHVIQWVH